MEIYGGSPMPLEGPRGLSQASQSREGTKLLSVQFRGVSRMFQRRGGGRHTVSNIIVMAFSPRNIVGCLLKKRLIKGRSRAPQDPPRYALAVPILDSSFVLALASNVTQVHRT